MTNEFGDSVTARPNLSYIIRFGPYRPHGFVPGDVSPLLSLTPQNAYDKLATNTLNKASYQSLTRRCGILQSTPLKEPDDPVGTTRQPVRLALIPNVTARPNLPYIVRLGPYRPHSFVPGDASPLLSLTPQNTFDKLATNTLNKANYQSLTRRCGILQSTPLMKPDDPVGTIGQPVRLVLIPNVTARPNLPYIVRFGPYRPHGFVPGNASQLLSLTPQNAFDKLATSTLNKASYQSLTRQCGILQSNCNNPTFQAQNNNTFFYILDTHGAGNRRT